jgi:hypothetical protein
MTVTATCGHDITNEKEIMLAIMGYSRLGGNAVSHGVYCSACRKQYEKWGIVLHTEEEQRKWMRGELEYPE